MNEKQKLIINAAQTVLIRDGGSQFSTRKVAAEAGMSQGNLQYHYKTKFDLLAGVLDNYLVEYQRFFDQFIEQPSTGYEGLKEFVQLIVPVEASQNDKKLFQALAHHLSEPGLADKLTEFFTVVHDLVVKCLDIISERQRSATELKMAANLFVVYVEGHDLLKSYIGSNDKEAAMQLTEVLSQLLGLEDRLA